MNRTKIEWVRNQDGTAGYTCNPETGCLNHTPEGLCLGGMFPCYAFRTVNGWLKERYLANDNVSRLPIYPMIEVDPYVYNNALLNPFYPRWWPERLDQIRKIKKPTGIFPDDMSDWMGDYWPKEWTEAELQVMRDCPQHRFYTLTKQPQNLPQWSPFPKNCWVGVTATKPEFLLPALDALDSIQCSIRYLSIEPMLAGFDVPDLSLLLEGSVDWLIIGACPGTREDMEALIKRYPDLTLMPFEKKWTAQPPIEWVEEIITACDKAGVKVFEKDNLKPLIDKYCPDESNIQPNHNSLLRMKHPFLCKDCDATGCCKCGVIWPLRQEMLL